RAKLTEIMKELRLSQYGITASDEIKVGNLLNATNLIIGEILDVSDEDSTKEFSIKNIEVESGKILWKYEFILNEKDLSNSLNNNMKELSRKIP
ncbi:MAG: hypothetical protein KDK36_16965, partial [Leptospiraceae bacterium]|nr:hypothetical protein [Leptospiraceae bacterium]